MTPPLWLSYVLHWSALVPLLLVLVRYDLPEPYKLVAVAFAVSWLADTVAFFTGMSWAVTQFYPGPQFALMTYALGSVLWPAVLFSLSLLPPYDGPDLLVHGVGALAVLRLARGPLAASVRTYGLATLLYLVLAVAFVYPIWYIYQGVRVVAFALFVKAAHARN